MPREVVETTDNNDVTEGLDEGTTPKVATPPVVQTKTKSKEDEVAKLEVTPEELEAKVEAAVQAKLQEREEAARREEAVKQGNYENLFNEAKERIHELELNSWKNKALTKFKLSEDFFDSLIGDTEDEVLRSAKKLKSAIDAEVAQAAQVATPPPSGKRTAPRDVGSPDVTRDVLRNSFVPRVRVRH